VLTVALKGLLAHKVRVLMTALSIALGVAFVSGTFVLTDSMNGSFAGAFSSRYAGVDVDVRAPAAFAAGDAAGQRRPLPATRLSAVRAVPGVARAEGNVFGLALMVGKDGKALGRGLLATQGTSAPSADGLGGDVHYRSGRAPAAPGEVAIDAASARKAGFRVGDRMRIVLLGPPQEFTVVGVAGFGAADSMGATTTALFDPAAAPRLLGKPGAYDEIAVRAAAGTTAVQLRDRLRAALPGADVQTGRAVAAEQTDLVKGNLAFLNIFLLVFAAIAVFVGSFIIWNTFSILVAQRSRELALLRALGATRGQVLRSVLAESVVVGLVASALGLVLGIGIARLLAALLGTTGLDLPTPGASLSARTVVVSFAVGTVVTVLASLAPARKATRVAPVEALRDAAPGGYRFSRTRAISGGVVLAGGLAALGAGLWGGASTSVVGIGVLLVFLGVNALLPPIAKALALVLGAPLPRLVGMTGKLARDNAVRNPKRTASTAAALMIGLALVGTVTVLASSLKTSIGSDIDRTARAELVVQQLGGTGQGLSPDAARAVRQVPGVAAASELASGGAKIAGSVTTVSPVDPGTISSVADLGVRTGSVAALGTDGVLVYDDVARAKGWTVGTRVPVQWPETGVVPMRVAGTFSEKGAVDSEYLVSMTTFDRNTTGRLDSLVLVKTAAGARTAAVQAGVVSALKPYVNAEVLTRAEFKQSIAGQVDQFLLFVTALLLLAVFIALMGIVNTLALSVLERTREIGLLRAVGMTRAQIRSMVRYESVIISLIGAVAGGVIGVGFGVALVKAMGDQGVSQLTLPAGRLAVYAVAAALAGVLAAVLPARRAAQVDVLRAVVSE
jgi:putative ABC transport system permease protein